MPWLQRVAVAADVRMALAFPEMQQFIFESRELPAHWRDDARFAEWERAFLACYRPLIVARADAARFTMRFEFARFGPVGVGEFAGSAIRITQASRQQHAPEPDAVIVLDRGSLPLLLSHAGALVPALPPDCGRQEQSVHRRWTGLVVARRALRDAVIDAEALLDRPLDAAAPAVRHLQRYLDILGGPSGLAGDALMHAHIGATLLDLIVLALLSGRDARPSVLKSRLRASRLQQVVVAIESDFADPAFSAHVVARKLGLSARYIQDLLQGSGSNFTERVMELRLQKARSMLMDDRQAQKISDVALACGFNEVSYFHRNFRRRFGVSPAQFRNGQGST